MDFSLRRVGNQNLHLYDSTVDSSLQLVFVPGILGPSVWRHQVKYFSRKFHTVTYNPTVSKRGFEGQEKALEAVLSQDSIRNAVLIGQGPANTLVQRFEKREDVSATVLTGVDQEYKSIPRELFRVTAKIGCWKPKLLKKFMFSELTDYSVVKGFVDDLELVSYDDFRSFVEKHSLRKPVKQSMIVHAENDIFSDREVAKNLEGAKVSILDSGSFSFYEKPQEYNKALHDFLTSVQRLVEEREIYKAASENHSLKEFEKKQKVELKNDSRPYTEENY
ncbi:MAG: alpha/beta fold hydrolase [Candidatus Nanohalobium sp.]